MKTKIAVAMVVIAALLVAILLVSRREACAPVTVTLRIAVNPAEQSAFVAGEANSARFKYLMGKQAGVKPFLAQKLSVKPLPNSSLLEARICVLTRDQGKCYADAFVGTLQGLCSTQAQVALAERTVH